MRATRLAVSYGEKIAIENVSIDVHARQVLALIGPSGCGKSTFLRSLNRMNDTVSGVSVSGQVELDGEPIYGTEVDPVLVRRRVGMVFQRSNPFPKSIFENVAYGLRIANVRERGRHRRARRARPPPCGALGRGQGSARRVRPQSLGRAAAASLHRARSGRRARGALDGRARERARPNRDRQDRRSRRRPARASSRSSSSPTTCNKPRASRSARAFSTWDAWWRWATRRRSSRAHGNARQRTTSQGDSADMVRRTFENTQPLPWCLRLGWLAATRARPPRPTSSRLPRRRRPPPKRRLQRSGSAVRARCSLSSTPRRRSSKPRTGGSASRFRPEARRRG